MEKPVGMTFKELRWKEFQNDCRWRKWTSFGHYDCQHELAKKPYCPRSRYQDCPIFLIKEYE